MKETYLLMRDNTLMESLEIVGEEYDKYSNAICKARELSRSDLKPTYIFTLACVVEAEVTITETKIIG